MLAGDVSIKEFMESIEKGNILLPMIQRPFVWTEERVESLFDSVIKRFPFGIILLYKRGSNDPNIFGRRFFEGIDANTNYETYNVIVEPEKIIVLDGHQRLQSLYLGFKGHTFNGKRLYYDITFFTKEIDISGVSFKFFKSDKVIEQREDSIFVMFSKIIEFAKKIHEITPQKAKEGRFQKCKNVDFKK